MTDARQIRLREIGDRNVVGAFAGVIPHIGGRGEVRSFGQALLVFGDSESPFFNRIFVLRNDVRASDVAAAIAHVRALGRQPTVHVRDDLDGQIGPEMRRLGFEPDAWASPSMVLDPIPASIPLPPDSLRLVELAGGPGAAERIEEWHSVAGFGPIMRRAFPPGVLDDPAIRVIIGYDADGPVCNAAAIRSDEEFGIYAVGTHKRARNRGYGTAVTWTAVDAGRRAWGLNVVALQSSELGLGLYSRMGFVQVCRYTEYTTPKPAPEERAPQG
jgi:GNAT superfamily N-acetyltransferase